MVDKKKETITEKYAKKPKTAKPSNLGKGGASLIAKAMVNRKKQIDSYSK